MASIKLITLTLELKLMKQTKLWRPVSLGEMDICFAGGGEASRPMLRLQKVLTAKHGGETRMGIRVRRYDGKDVISYPS